MTEERSTSDAMNAAIRQGFGHAPPNQPAQAPGDQPEDDAAWLEREIYSAAEEQGFADPEDVVAILLANDKYHSLLARPPGGGRPFNVDRIVRAIRYDKPQLLGDSLVNEVRARHERTGNAEMNSLIREAARGKPLPDSGAGMNAAIRAGLRGEPIPGGLITGEGLAGGSADQGARGSAPQPQEEMSGEVIRDAVARRRIARATGELE